MATFLELCADLARESGAIGTAPSAVTGQTGRQEKAVEWVKRAWTLIQADQPDWDFLRTEFEGALVAGTKRYSGAALGLSNHAEWIGGHRTYSIYKTGEQDQESYLREISYDAWKATFDFRTHENQRPTVYAISPAGELCLGATPDAAYVIRGTYQRKPQELADNGDIPIAPSRFHDIIWQRAHMLLCAHDEAWNAYKAAEGVYKANLRNMQRDCLPEITTGGNTLQ